MISGIILVFVIAILGNAFTGTIQSQVNQWSFNLTNNGQSAAATVVGLLPLLFWVLLAVGLILVIVKMFLPSRGGL